jgi:hypothetical protein
MIYIDNMITLLYDMITLLYDMITLLQYNDSISIIVVVY